MNCEDCKAYIIDDETGIIMRDSEGRKMKRPQLDFHLKKRCENCPKEKKGVEKLTTTNIKVFNYWWETMAWGGPTEREKQDYWLRKHAGIIAWAMREVDRELGLMGNQITAFQMAGQMLGG